GESGQPRRLPGHAQARRRPSDRGSRPAPAGDDVVDQAAERMMSKVPIAREGWPFVGIPGALALGLALLGHRRLALPFAAAAAACAGVTVVQIAGIIGRRIVCYVAPGDKLDAGARFGMIRFGSRTDCYMPRSTEVTVRPGEHLRGGQTVIGVLT